MNMRTVLCVCVLTTLVLVGDVAVAEELPLPTRGICAHRGASETHPENTLAAFREAIRLGAHMIEFDVYLCKDQHLVVMHDPNVDRTTNGTGRIAELTLAEIKKLDAGVRKGESFKGETVPTLEEALAIMPRTVWLNIHLKEGRECGKRTAQAVAAANRLHQAFLACNVEAADGAKEVAPGVLICHMEDRRGPSYVDHAIERKAQFIQLYRPKISEVSGFTEKLKANNVKVNCFGLEKPDELRSLFKSGVDFPLVNDVAKGLEVAAEFGIDPRR